MHELPPFHLAFPATCPAIARSCPQGELGRLLMLMLELDHDGLPSLLDPRRTRQHAAHG